MAETSKKRTVRIPLDYYKRPDRLARWRRLLSALAVLLGVAWAAGIGWDFWSPARRQERARQLATHGPLTRSHAAWEMQCEACHTPFQAIGVETWAIPVFGDARLSSQRCQACHAAGLHHVRQQPPDPACASCHHDHQGRDASLVRNGDQQCVQCHADLVAHVQGGATGAAPRVSRFDVSTDSHPEFRSTKDPDPGHIKFDHARHLTLGMGTEKFGRLQTLEMIPEADRPRYEKYAQGAKGLIQLDCVACHQLSRDDPGSSAPSPPPRSGPAYMLPVNYQTHCRACHPLGFDPSADSLVMEHPLQTDAVDATLWQTYTMEYLRQNPALLDQRISPRPVPGRSEPPALVEARAAIDRKVAGAERILFTKCNECHYFQDGAGKECTPPVRWDPTRPVRSMATNIPLVWWRSAAFTHTAHRGVSCRSCHERAYPDSKDASGTPNPSHQSKDVLLPSKSECLQCHAPRSGGTGASLARGGAAFDCTECHRYHDGDAAILGRTPLPDAPSTALTIEQFLLGTSPPGHP
jgi:predicted CXXCH cytochrome family protein